MLYFSSSLPLLLLLVVVVLRCGGKRDIAAAAAAKIYWKRRKIKRVCRGIHREDMNWKDDFFPCSIYRHRARSFDDVRRNCVQRRAVRYWHRTELPTIITDGVLSNVFLMSARENRSISHCECFFLFGCSLFLVDDDSTPSFLSLLLDAWISTIWIDNVTEWTLCSRSQRVTLVV